LSEAKQFIDVEDLEVEIAADNFKEETDL